MATRCQQRLTASTWALGMRTMACSMRYAHDVRPGPAAADRYCSTHVGMDGCVFNVSAPPRDGGTQDPKPDQNKNFVSPATPTTSNNSMLYSFQRIGPYAFVVLWERPNRKRTASSTINGWPIGPTDGRVCKGGRRNHPCEWVAKRNRWKTTPVQECRDGSYKQTT